MKNRHHHSSDEKLYWVRDNVFSDHFPTVNAALSEPDGLLAIGGNLTVECLSEAYQSGIFPWFNQDYPILWWSPDPRCVLELNDFKISASLRKTLRKRRFTVTFNRAFSRVIANCAKPRKDSGGTWITKDMAGAYNRLHKMGYAHSVECWRDDKLVGGLYGVSFGRIFFGESMFSHATDASKVALAHFVRETKLRGFRLIDCQLHSQHLQSLGAIMMPRERFIAILDDFCSPEKTVDWPATSTFEVLQK